MQKIICGLDEAGRGPLAGPVTAGAVVLSPDFPVEILNDSKKLSEKKRIQAEAIIKEKACWGIGIVDHETIDKINILRASLYAMKLAFDMLMIKLPDFFKLHNIVDYELCAIADGIYVPNIDLAEKSAVVKADSKFSSVMAASIIAKVERDNIMLEMDKLYPQYNYKQHKGYPTKEHRELCRKYGPSPIQRMSFKY